jgi:hypothetical protein
MVRSVLIQNRESLSNDIFMSWVDILYGGLETENVSLIMTLEVDLY